MFIPNSAPDTQSMAAICTVGGGGGGGHKGPPFFSFQNSPVLQKLNHVVSSPPPPPHFKMDLRPWFVHMYDCIYLYA